MGPARATLILGDGDPGAPLISCNDVNANPRPCPACALRAASGLPPKKCNDRIKMNPSFPNLRAGILALGLGIAGGVAANATSVTIANNSFETPTVASDSGFVTASHSASAGSYTGTFNSWNYALTVGGTSPFADFGIENPAVTEYTGASSSGTPSGADGVNVVFLNNKGTAGLTTSIFQDVGLLQANTTYTLTIAIGQRLDRTNGSVQIGLLSGASGATNIWSTGTLLNSTTAVSSVAGTFQDFQVVFTTGSTVSNDLYVGALYTSDGKIQASLDNVRLDATSAIPEASTYAGLLGIAALGAALVRRRRG